MKDVSMSADQSVPPYAIEAINLEKTYKGSGKLPPKQALKGIDLQIPTGSIFGLLGPNGAGKSTFINILSGLVMKTGGAAKIWGHDIETAPRSARAAIGVVPQEINMDPFFTPMEAIIAATKWGSQIMLMEDDIGTVEEGKYADLIGVDGDPLDDIEELMDVDFVMKGGVIYKNEE